MRRAVVDTDGWVSALLNPAGAPALVLAAFLAGRFVVVTGEPMLAELREVLGRPQLVLR